MKLFFLIFNMIPAAQAGDMPDLLKGIATTGCDNGPGVYGAVDYFHDQLEVASDGSVTGTETWILYANNKLLKKWKAEGVASPCKVTWNLKGKKVAGTRGDLGLSLVNSLVDTTCPKETVNKYKDTNQKIHYEVSRSSDGTARFTFKSGKFVGDGYHKDGKFQFLTNKSCRWF